MSFRSNRRLVARAGLVREDESPAVGRAAYAALTVAMVAGGATWPAGKLATDHVPPAVIAILRFSAAAVLLWLWAWLIGTPVRRPSRGDLPLVALMGGSVVFAYNLLFLYGLRHAPATDGAVLVPGLVPVATTLFQWWTSRERPAVHVAAGLALALAGVIVVSDPTSDLNSGRLFGDGLFVAAAFSWSIYTLAGRRAAERFGSVNANVYATSCGTLLLLPVSFVGGGWSPLARAPVQALAGIAYLALGGTVLLFVAFYEGVRLIGPARASSFLLLIPIFGVLSSAVVLGERLHARVVVGGVLVVAGLWLAESRRGTGTGTALPPASRGPGRRAGQTDTGSEPPSPP